MSPLRIFFIFLSLLASLAGCSHGPVENPSGPADALKKPYDFEVQGHRGARGVRPENTLPAFRYALEVGVDALEMDLQVTRDGVLVVSHDPLLSPELCLDSKGRPLTKPVVIRRLKLMELKSYDCGTLVNPRFPEQVPEPKSTIPTFEEVLRTVQGSKLPSARRVRLNVEMKSDPEHPEFVPPPKRFAAMVIRAVKRRGLLFRTVLQSFDYRTLVAARELEPSVTLSVLVEDRPKETLSELAQRYKAQIISPNQEWLKKEDVEDAHNFGIKVLPWTADTPDEWRKLAEIGVDGIITDYPKALLEFRAASGGPAPTH